MESTVTEILTAWREADPAMREKVLDYLRRVNSPDQETRERARAELLAEVADHQ